MQELEQLRFAGRVWEAICGFLFSQQGRGAERESAPADSAVQTVAQRDSINPKSPRFLRGLLACRSNRHVERVDKADTLLFFLLKKIFLETVRITRLTIVRNQTII